MAAVLKGADYIPPLHNEQNDYRFFGGNRLILLLWLVPWFKFGYDMKGDL